MCADIINDMCVIRWLAGTGPAPILADAGLEVWKRTRHNSIAKSAELFHVWNEDGNKIYSDKHVDSFDTA